MQAGEKAKYEARADPGRSTGPGAQLVVTVERKEAAERDPDR